MRQHCPLEPLLPQGHSEAARKRIGRALEFAARAHRGQTRRSGDPYVSHPYAVACIVRDLGMDAGSICAALLHDVSEDCGVSTEELRKNFGKGVAGTVESLSKLGGISDKTQRDADAMRRMVVATSQDPRVALIKLCDRLHNTRTLGHMPPYKARRIVQETRDLHAPLARRLGLYEVYTELLDNCLAVMHPWRYQVLRRAIDGHLERSQQNVSQMLEQLLAALRKRGVQGQVQNAPLTVAGVLRRLRGRASTFRNGMPQILRGGRYVLTVPDDCDLYSALGALHSVFAPVSGGFIDYVAQPKANGYQSLHTRLRREDPPGPEVLILLRTQSMDALARLGLLADSGKDRVQTMHGLFEAALDPALDTLDFPEEVRRELQPSRVVVYTPEGGMVRLPRGATGLDFAYAQPDDQGPRALSVVVDGVDRPLGATLEDGAWVGLRLADTPQVSSAWLSMVTTSRARRRINEYLQSDQRRQLQRLGEQELRARLQEIDAELADIPEQKWQALLDQEGLQDQEQALQRLAEDTSVLDAWVAVLVPPTWRRYRPRLLPWVRRQPLELPAEVEAELATCCYPVGGDLVRLAPAEGKSGNLQAHLASCPHQRVKARGGASTQMWRQLPVAPGRTYPAAVHLTVIDRGKGTLRAVLEAFEEMDIDIRSFQNLHHLGHTEFLVIFHVPGRDELAGILKRLRRWPGVRKVQRHHKPPPR